MRKLIFIILLLENSLFSHAQVAKATLDTNAILIGEQIKFKIECESINNPINWPIFHDTIINGIEIISKSEIDTTSEYDKNTDNQIFSLSQEYIITAWDSGVYYIPPFKLNNNITTEALLLNVMSIAIDKNANLKDIKQPLDPKYELSDFLPWILLFTCIILIIYLLRKYMSNKKENPITTIAKTIIPAHITALEELNNIEKQELWQSGKIKKYHSGISEILRKYMEDRFNFIALELTTDEILIEIKDKIAIDNHNELRKTLQRADLAKFAKSKPNENENKESMQLARRFINQTKKSENKNE